MNRFFIPPGQIKAQTVVFPENLSHQILHVLRMQAGEMVQVLDDSGMVFTVQLAVEADGKTVRGEITDRQPAKSEPPVEVELCCGLTHRDKLEWILQKGTEVGVTAFSPFVSARTLVQSTALKPSRRERWEAIIREAAEQSGRGRLPRLNDPRLYQDLMDDQAQSNLSLLAWEGADPATETLAAALSGPGGGKLRLLVGPEGGLSEEEVRAAREAGWQVVSLGTRTLRMETAAILFPGLALQIIENLNR
jgi:16S rRNA (uracil1498-N3)-methyltransferase